MKPAPPSAGKIVPDDWNEERTEQCRRNQNDAQAERAHRPKIPLIELFQGMNKRRSSLRGFAAKCDAVNHARQKARRAAGGAWDEDSTARRCGTCLVWLSGPVAEQDSLYAHSQKMPAPNGPFFIEAGSDTLLGPDRFAPSETCGARGPLDAGSVFTCG